MSLLEWNYLIHRPLFEENKRSTVTEEKKNTHRCCSFPVVIVHVVFTPCVGECSWNLVWTVMYVSSLLYIFDCLKRVCEYNTLFCVWSILVLDKRVGSPLQDDLSYCCWKEADSAPVPLEPVFLPLFYPIPFSPTVTIVSLWCFSLLDIVFLCPPTTSFPATVLHSDLG